MLNEFRIPSVTKSLANATESVRLIPRAKPAAMAEAKVHPVPWVLAVSILGLENS